MAIDKSIGVLVGGLGLCGAACLLAPTASAVGAGTLAAVVGGALAGVGQALAPNIAADLFSRLSDWTGGKLRDKGAAAKNHDLRELVIVSIENVLDDVIKSKVGGADGVNLLVRYKAKVRDRQGVAAIDDRFKGTWEQTIPQYFKARLEEFSTVKALTPEIWRDFLKEVSYEVLNTDEQTALDKAATALYNDLPKHLVGAYRDALQHHPTVFVAVQTAILQEIWNVVSNVDQKVDALRDSSQATLAEIRNVGEAVAVANLAAMQKLAEEFTTTGGEFRVLFWTIRFLSSDTLRLVTEMHADIKELLRLQADDHALFQQILANQPAAGLQAEDQSVGGLLEHEVLDAAQENFLASLLTRKDTSGLDSQMVQAAIESPIKGLRGYLLQRYAQACRHQGMAVWLESGEIRLDTDFIDLQLLVQPHVDGSPEQRFNSLSTILSQAEAINAWVLVGDAGGGKTTVLRHHEMLHARRLLLSIEEWGADSITGADLCIWLRLAAYRRERVGNDLRWPDCEQWLQAQWSSHAATVILPSLALLRRHFRLRFLLDGINEIEPGTDPAVRQQAMRQFAEWTNEFRNAQPAPVFSVRRHDRGVALLEVDGLTVRQVDLVRWSPERVEQFCHHGRSEYGVLWKKLKADSSLLALCQVPFNLTAQCALHDQGYFADNRADLFLGLIWLSLRRALRRGELSETGLLSALDQNKISDRRHWKLRRRVLPTEGTLLRGLEQQARDMAHEVEVAYGKAALFSWPDFNRRDWLAAVQAIGVAEVRTDDTGDQFAFAHQLWQEFFTALGLVENLEPLVEMRASPLKPMSEQLGSLKGQEPLPKPDTLNCEEAIKLAVQLTHRPDEIVSQLAEVNLALSGRAAAGCLSRLPADIASRLRMDLLERCRNNDVDLRLRIEAAEALGLMGDVIRYEKCGGLGTAAATHLLPCREPMRTSIHRSGWIHVVGGIYAIGSHKGQAGADSDEWGPGGEALSVELKPFDIAFAPVTNAEFAQFSQDGGYDNDRWWAGDVPSRWRRGELRDDGARDWQMRRHAALVADFDDALNRFFFARTPTNVEFANSFRALSREEAEAKVDSWYPFSGKPPAFMDLPDFNNPLQPVVGISLFEAEAYCRWLSAQSGLRVRLPTEAEWEAAARGQERRPWPWGEHEPTLESFNADSLHLLRTSPVGVFPAGDTPEGMVDVAGNVWEWSTSEYTPERLSAERVNTPAEPEALRTLRGGGHDFIPAHCRPSYRFKCNPLMRNNVIGFRIVCD
jgi:formylglycine-generating enzyme required for sulfatase activity